MYTLWSMETESRTLPNGRPYTIDIYRYIKSLSKNKDKAFAKAPEGAEFNDSLRGRRGSFATNKQWVDNHTPTEFAFGKYYGLKFADCKDIDYMMWYFNTTQYEDQKQTIIEILTKFYSYEFDGTFLLSPDQVRERNAFETWKRTTKAKLICKAPFKIVFEKNLNGEGEYNADGVTLRFEHKVYYYEGYPYGLPLDTKGKAKRVKNKTIEIIDSEQVEDDVFKITNWRIV